MALRGTIQLFVHIFLDQMHRDVAWTFVHDLDSLFPGAFRKFALNLEFAELRRVVGIGD